MLCTRDKDELEQISKLVQSIGIDFKNWQIGSRRQQQNVKISDSSRKKQKGKVTKVFSSNKNNNTLNRKLLNLPPQDEEKTSGSKHLCNDCGRSFFYKSKLKRHKMLHLGIKFGCNICSFKNYFIKQHCKYSVRTDWYVDKATTNLTTKI